MHKLIKFLKAIFARKPEIERFKSKRAEWLYMLNGDDKHSIIRQVYNMVWDAAVFHVISEVRQRADSDEMGSVKLNGMIQNLINRGFVESQMNAIRRLADKGSSKKEWSVFSLRHLIDDMQSNIDIFTRGNVFAAEELFYDYEKVRDEFREAHQGGEACWVPEDQNWVWSEIRHKHLDVLCRVKKQKRKENDRIARKVFKGLRKRLLSTTEDMIEYTNKFIAHAASPESREAVGADEMRPKLNDLWLAHEAICRLVGYISVFLLGSASHGFLVTPQYDQFKYIEEPWVKSSDCDALENIWKRYRKETESWGDNKVDLLS